MATLPNVQRPVPIDRSDGERLLVHSIFYTIQGEGPFAGRPAIFVRFAGCNLQCPLCDTDYTVTPNAEPLPITQLARTVFELSCDYPAEPTLVVITGGEPFRQNIAKFIDYLCGYNFTVQVETNGRLAPQDTLRLNELRNDGVLHIVVSPKTHRLDRYFAYPEAYKYVITDGDEAEDGLPRTALDHPVPAGKVLARPPEDFVGPVYVQAADHQDEEINRRNLAAAVRSVDAAPNRRLCIQMHKLAELP